MKKNCWRTHLYDPTFSKMSLASSMASIFKAKIKENIIKLEMALVCLIWIFDV